MAELAQNAVYVLTKDGVYCQGVVGVFRTQEGAEIAALVSIQDEHDDYHHFKVDAFEMNNRTDEPRPISTFRRVEKRVYRANTPDTPVYWKNPPTEGDELWYLVAGGE